MRQNINAYTITYTPKNAFRRRRVTEGFISFSEARTRAIQILTDKCSRIYGVAEEQFIEDGVVHYRLFAYSSRSRYSITIKSLTAVETNALRNDFDNIAKREKEKNAETPAPAPTDSVGGAMIRKMIEEYEKNNR
jgi:hypothetical protein